VAINESMASASQVQQLKKELGDLTQLHASIVEASELVTAALKRDIEGLHKQFGGS
jgi:hypothetical protein